MAGYRADPGSYLEEIEDREWKTFHRTLHDFPHTFQLQDQHLLTPGTCRKLQHTLQADLDAGLKTSLETARTHNFLGYLLLLLQQPRESLEQTERALSQDGEERNVVSLANMAVILWNRGQRLKAREQVQKLEGLRNDPDFSYLVVKAKAELGFSCTRLGAHFAPLAVQMFSAALEEAREPEVWLWKFGLALTERRAVHVHCIPMLTVDSEDKRLLAALRTYLEVIDNCRNDNLKAKCYAEVAHLLQGRWRSESQELFQRETKGLTPIKACHKALALDPQDCSVLWKCGRIFRYVKRLDESCQYLQKSVDLRPTTAEYHHLGLTYKALANRAKYQGTGRGHGRGRGGRQRGGWRGRQEGCGDRGWRGGDRGWRGGGDRGWRRGGDRGWRGGDRGWRGGDRGWRGGGGDRGRGGERAGRGTHTRRKLFTAERGQGEESEWRQSSGGLRGRGGADGAPHQRGRALTERGRWQAPKGGCHSNKTEDRGGLERQDCEQDFTGSYSRLLSSAQQGYHRGDRQSFQSHHRGDRQSFQSHHRGDRQSFQSHHRGDRQSFQSHHRGDRQSFQSHQWDYQRGYWQGHQQDQHAYQQDSHQERQGHFQGCPGYQEDNQRWPGSEATGEGQSGREAWGGSDVTDTESQDELTQKRGKTESLAQDSAGDMQLSTLATDISKLSLNVSSSPANITSSSVNVQNTPASTTNSSVNIQNSPSSSTSSSVSFQNSPASSTSSSASFQNSPASDISPDIKSLRRIVKSPSKEATTFSRSDAFIPEAMAAFEKAVKLSQSENYRAIYDLALMHKALGEWNDALQQLECIQQGRQSNMGLFDKINAYEQAGLVLKEMSEQESNDEKRKLLQEEGESKLDMALLLCSRLCNRLPRLQHVIQHVWHSFPTLIQAAEQSDCDDTDKLREKARLYQLIRDNQQSMALLQQIQNIAPEKARSPDFLKMCIENYVHLKHYDQALAFIETLKNTAQRSALDLFEDGHYVQKVYMQAGKAALLSTTAADSSSKAGSYFSAAFNDAHLEMDAEMTSDSEDSDSVEQSGDNESWDIVLLYEQSADNKAHVLAQVLEEACGLRVARMTEDCLPGRLQQDSVVSIMSRSKQVVVLAGGRPVSHLLRLLIETAVKKQSTVTLLVEGDHVPKLFRSTGRRHMVCPPQLLIGGEGDGGDDCCGGGGAYTEEKAQAIFNVFSFLTEIPCV